jgi:ankyrin repeat protein
LSNQPEVELVKNFLNKNFHVISLNDLYLKLQSLPQDPNITQITDFIDQKFAQIIEEKFKSPNSEDDKVAELKKLISEGSKNASCLPELSLRAKEIETIEKVIATNNFSSSSLYSLFEAANFEAPNQYNRRITHFLSPLILGSVSFDLQKLFTNDSKSEQSAPSAEKLDYFKQAVAAAAKAYRWKMKDLPTQVVEEVKMLKGFIKEDFVKTEDLHGIFSSVIAEEPSDYNLQMADFFIPLILEETRKKLADLENSSLEEKIKGLHKIIAESSKTYPKSTSAAYPQLHLEKNLVIDFIKRHPEISEAENFTAVLTRKDILKLEKQPSLLHLICSQIPTAYNLDIIHILVKNSRDLSKRSDLLEVMIADNTSSSDPDMSQTFDLFVEKGIPLPLDYLVSHMITHPRLKSVANKLAKSFLYYRDDVEMVKKILGLGIKDNDRKNLEEFLTNAGFQNSDDRILLKHIECLVKVNNDELLHKLFATKNLGQRLLDPFLARLPDHNSPLILAAESKLIKTYEILINAGFDPLKHPQGETNSFALACKDQGLTTLKPFLEACADKAEMVVTEIDKDGKSALDHAIEGETAYLEVVKFLLSKGAAIETKHLIATADLGHAGVFDFLLKQKFLTESQIDEIREAVKQQGNYVISSIFIDYLEKLSYEKSDELKATLSAKEFYFRKQDLFHICETGGEKTFQYYIKARQSLDPEFLLETEINKRDSQNRTPLHCAISGPAFSSLVKILIDQGANPNEVGQINDEEIDAATLAIKNIQPKTLSVILGSQRFSQENPLGLSSQSIARAADELEKHNEAVLTASFIGGLSLEEINGLKLEIRKTLFAKSLQTENPETIAKMNEAVMQGDEAMQSHFKQVFQQAIESSNVNIVQYLAFGVLDLLEEDQKNYFSSNENFLGAFLEEDLPKTKNVAKASSQQLVEMEKRSVNSDENFMAKALLAVKEKDSVESRQVLQILLGAGFKFLESEKESQKSAATR